MFVSLFYTTGFVNKAGLAYSYGAPEVTAGFGGVRVVSHFLFLCVMVLPIMSLGCRFHG